jgi:diguanylate cyclase (GGDEF)-like protein
MLAYTLVNGILVDRITGNVFSVISFVFFLAIFVISYYCEPFVAYCVLNAYILLWVIANVISFGWNIGVQHFLAILLVFCFFAKYRHIQIKLGYSVCLIALRLWMYYYCNANDPWEFLSESTLSTLQVVNTITIFGILALLSYLFSTDSQELEGKLVEYNERLQKQANTDTLTGLFNRRKTMEYLDGLLKATENQISICLCDIDFFKRVNDTYGHDIGDVVLQTIARSFRTGLPQNTFISRWGGEEFLLIFPTMNGDEANVALEHLRQKIKGIVFDGGHEKFSVSLTYGLVEYDYVSNLDTILKQADEKLYIGKENGRDRIVF